MPKVIIYKSTNSFDDENDNYKGVIAILNYAMIRYEVIVDIREMMVRSHGRVNPHRGFVVIIPDTMTQPKSPIIDCLALAHWIYMHGFRPL